MTGEGRMAWALRWVIRVVIAIVVVMLFGLWVVFSKAFALDGHTHEGAAGKFYQTWTMPDNRKVSCCHDQDCAPAEARLENGRWIARPLGDKGNFTPVPQSKIEQERDSPDGLNHICARRDGFGSLTIFCFLPAQGG